MDEQRPRVDHSQSEPPCFSTFCDQPEKTIRFRGILYEKPAHPFDRFWLFRLEHCISWDALVMEWPEDTWVCEGKAFVYNSTIVNMDRDVLHLAVSRKIDFSPSFPKHTFLSPQFYLSMLQANHAAANSSDGYLNFWSLVSLLLSKANSILKSSDVINRLRVNINKWEISTSFLYFCQKIFIYP